MKILQLFSKKKYHIHEIKQGRKLGRKGGRDGGERERGQP
jgi:hypothetical protein